MRVSLEAKPRPPMSKGETKRLRKEGYIPITVSDPGKETQMLSAPAQAIRDAFLHHGFSTLIRLTLEGKEVLVIPRDIQRGPVSGKVIHIGFRRVSAKEMVSAEVAITLEGVPESAKSGSAVIDQQANTILVRALPDKLPSNISVDISDLEVGAVLHAGDIPKSPDYEIASPADTVIAVLHVTRAATSDTEEEEVAPEPEA